MKKVCVYCGSNYGNDPIFENAAKLLGKEISKNGLGLVFGGGNVGLMKVIADTVLENGQEVIGVIPESLADLEIAHTGITKLHVVKSMHDRKALMADLSNIFIAMPGGFGTFEEILEVLTWTQLGIHEKPCGILNVNGFYDQLLQFFDEVTKEGFIKSTHRSMLVCESDPEQLLQKLLSTKIKYTPKWVDKKII